jgi:hypothetical protein
LVIEKKYKISGQVRKLTLIKNLVKKGVGKDEWADKKKLTLVKKKLSYQSN